MTLTSPTRGHLGHVNTGDVNLRLLVKVMSARTFHYKVTVNVFSFMFVCAQWCLILCDPKDSSSPGPTVASEIIVPLDEIKIISDPTSLDATFTLTVSLPAV